MKKIFVVGVVVGAILALGAMAFSFYSATNASAASTQSTSLFASALGNGAMFQDQSLGRGKHGDGPLQPYIEEAVADILGISIEDLQAAKDAGTKMSELLTTAGLTEEELKTALEAALPDIVAQALADEAITQEQADTILAKGLRSFGGRGEHGGMGGFGLNGDGVLQPYIETVVADILGISVEDLQAAKDAGTRLPELLDTAGLTVEDFQTAMEAAVPGIVEQALADGVITQAQADTILENGLRGAKGYIRSALQEYVDAAVADILGVTVEELQTARDNHTVGDLLDAAGLTREEVQTALDEVTPSILEQAVADGLITQAQADLLLEQGLHGFGGHGRGGGHGGGHGPHGDGLDGFGPGGSDSGTQDTPTTDTSSENG